VAFEPAIPSRELSQTDALDRAATGIGCFIVLSRKNGSITMLQFSIFGTIVIPVTRVQVTLWHQANNKSAGDTPASSECLGN
jgi:hypothetical protein